ncbi:MAG TPA: preprotein translocase subunit SecG [Ruminococcaceae bacterium]|jgi:preprotein translocase subunit SecG|nr:preprotein translocase subunit SecG [Oscillospiraceae bacterium]HCA28848.1 preprotein translocase subunit SecG [Oscillospiraceae bacterium]
MTGFEIAIGIVLIVLSLVIIAIVLLQEGRQSNLGTIQGAADSFLDKGRARTMDAVLAKWTKVVVAAFFVLVFVGMLVTKFLGA